MTSRCHRFAGLLAAAVVICVSWSFPLQAQSPAPAEPFKDELAAFDQWDAKNTPPAHAVLFVGSSTIRLWPTAAAFPGLTVINRGFGGSQIADVNASIDRTVLRYAADIVVFYAGDNDLNAGKTPERVLADYQEFVRRVLAARSETHILFIAVKPSLARWAIWDRMQQANSLVMRFSESNPNLHVVDLGGRMLGPDGTPRPELFVSDGLHMTPAGYAIWTQGVGAALMAVQRAMGR